MEMIGVDRKNVSIDTLQGLSRKGTIRVCSLVDKMVCRKKFTDKQLVRHTFSRVFPQKKGECVVTHQYHRNSCLSV